MSTKLTGSDKLLIGCVYRSPNSDEENTQALNDLFEEIAALGNKFTHILIMGDFNYPGIDWELCTTSADKARENFH